MGVKNIFFTIAILLIFSAVLSKGLKPLKAQHKTTSKVTAHLASVPVYRLYSPTKTDHIYTTNWAEVNYLTTSGGYFSEGIAFYANST